jgi:phosphatidylglycerol:prolipoprotein diacylglycerol transferase
MIPLVFIYWDPKPELFIIPGLNWPILWYGLLFSAGFAVGFPIFTGILIRYFLNRPGYMETDILDSGGQCAQCPRAMAESLNERIYRGEGPRSDSGSDLASDPASLKLVAKSRCLHPERALSRLAFDQKLGSSVLAVKKKAVQITDRLTVYMILATVIGARLGHFFFYEKPIDYLNDPLELFRVWEGGLASHGAAIAIVLAMFLFGYRVQKRVEGLNGLRLLDFVAVPTALAGAFIRVGNFFNQEILGTQSSLPWAVVFGHPADHSFPAPRHPVQLYEALFYLAVFFLLWRLSYRPLFLLARGKLIGLFLILVFGFRFLIEFLKNEQSHLVSLASSLTMGQYLSLPAIAAGFLLYFWKRK